MFLLTTLSAHSQNIVAPSGLAPTPPMGWASWNAFFCDYTEQTIRDQADALVSSGMRDLGYNYVLIQECIAPKRDAMGELVIDSKRFPGGMKALVDYIHTRGLKAGTYTDIGPYTCLPDPRYQGSYGYEIQDAKAFAAWGIDLVEMDYCNRVPEHTGREVYERMAKAIQDTGRPMVFYICSWGNESPWTWAQGKAQLWRTDTDISSKKNHVDWNAVVQRFESNARHAVFTGPNSWNDPDMLEAGNQGLNAVEAQTHFAMWAISAAPLWAGNDLTHMSDTIRSIYTNPEVIAINQDSLGTGVFKVKEHVFGQAVWVKPLGSLGSGVESVLLLNLTEHPTSVGFHWSDLGLSGSAQVRDLYTHKLVETGSEGYSVVLSKHGSALLKVSGAYEWSKGSTYEAEWPGNVREGNTSLLECPACNSNYAISLHGPGASRQDSILTFPSVVVPEAGDYQVSVSYSDSKIDSNQLFLQINQDKPAIMPIHYLIYGSEQTRVHLVRGKNVLTFRYSGDIDTKVNLDSICVYR